MPLVDKDRRLSEGLMLALLTALGYSGVYAYEFGYTGFFRVPLELVSVSLLDNVGLITGFALMFTIEMRIFAFVRTLKPQRQLLIGIPLLAALAILFIHRYHFHLELMFLFVAPFFIRDAAYTPVVELPPGLCIYGPNIQNLRRLTSAIVVFLSLLLRNGVRPRQGGAQFITIGARNWVCFAD